VVFKYLLGVFKYLNIAYYNRPLRKYALSLITVHILGPTLRNYQKIKDTGQKPLTAYNTYLNPNE